MSKARLKQPAGATLSRAEVECMVGELRVLANAEQKILADKNAAITAIEERCAPELQAIARQRKSLVALAQQWAEGHPEAFAKRKSLELTHGTIGFRTGTPKLVMTKRAGGWAGALERVMQFLPNFIREQPEIDKEALIAQREDEGVQFGLRQCGLAVEQGESFFVEPKLEQPVGTVSTPSPSDPVRDRVESVPTTRRAA